MAVISGALPAERKRNRQGDEEGRKFRKKAARHTVEHDHQAEILSLENSILESRKNYNNIVTLLTYANDIEVDHDRSILAAVALCRVFCRLMAGGNFAIAKNAPESELTVVRWLKIRLVDFENTALAWLKKGDDPSLQNTALTLQFRLLCEATKSVDHGLDSETSFMQTIRQLVDSTHNSPVIDDFVAKYVQHYDDVRHATFSAVTDTCLAVTSEDHLEHLLSLMLSIKPLDSEPKATSLLLDRSSDSKKAQKLYSRNAQMKQAQRAWITILRQTLTKSQRKRVLKAMTSQIAPWFLHVELLMDFLTDSFNVGGSTSLTAISGIFYLVQNENLDYPQFYTKLYSLLDEHILHSKHRSRFFRLLDTFLSSTHLPAALVASFIKRLSRLSLNSPPSGIVVVVPLIYNLLQSHPTCTYMIHRTSELIEKSEQHWGDPFIANESDPMETNAIESSLWEIETLQSHYHPNVATIAKIISEPFTKHAYNLEDFLDHSYATMLDAELSKGLKRQPEIEFEIPKRIFTRYEPDSGKEDSLLVKLCDFS